MKRSFAINMVLLALLGAMLFFGGRALGGQTSIYWEGGRPHVNKNATQTLSVTEQLSFTELEVRSSIGEIRIQSGRSFGIEGKYSNGAQPQYQLEGNALKVFDDGAGEHMKYNVGIMTFDANELVITIPDSMTLSRVDLGADVGSVHVDGLKAQSLTAAAKMGEVELKRIACDELSARTDVGSIDLKEAIVQKRTVLDTATGEINANGTFLGEAEMSADVGEIEVRMDQERSAYIVDAKSGLGSTKILPNHDKDTDDYGPNQLTLRTDIGGIRVRFKGQ